tara:strand:- start:1715 stop:2263 length:549 start_codon:yes stop_codon:yes gene_type:complete
VIGKFLNKYTIYFILLFSNAIFVSYTYSESNNSNIAVVNLQVAVLQTEIAQSKLKELEEEPDFKKNIDEAEALEKELKELIGNYQKERAVMSAQKRSEEEKRFREKQQDLNYIANKIQQAQKEIVDKIIESQSQNLNTVLNNLVEEQGIGLLLRAGPGGSVLHADKSYDISLQVTERLNQIK